MWEGSKIAGKMGLEGEILGCIYIRRKRDKEEVDKISRYSCGLAQMVILYYIV